MLVELGHCNQCGQVVFVGSSTVKRFEDVAADAVGILKTSVHHATHCIASGIGEVVSGEVLSHGVVELVKVALVASLAVHLVGRIIETVSNTLAHLLAEYVLFE